MPQVARLSDPHVCPLATPVPHGGGVLTGAGVPSVLFGGLAAAVAGDACSCLGAPNSVVGGSSSVLVGGKPLVRVGDPTAHGGFVSGGLASVMVGP